jgi:hypothetical protein
LFLTWTFSPLAQKEKDENEKIVYLSARFRNTKTITTKLIERLQQNGVQTEIAISTCPQYELEVTCPLVLPSLGIASEHAPKKDEFSSSEEESSSSEEEEEEAKPPTKKRAFSLITPKEKEKEKPN